MENGFRLELEVRKENTEGEGGSQRRRRLLQYSKSHKLMLPGTVEAVCFDATVLYLYHCTGEIWFNSAHDIKHGVSLLPTGILGPCGAFSVSISTPLEKVLFPHLVAKETIV